MKTLRFGIAFRPGFRSMPPSPLAFVIVAGLATHAFAETEVELRTRIVSPIRLVEVKEPAASPKDYRADADQNTIELVYMSERSDGPSRCSPDGQVIYLSRFGLNSHVKGKLVQDALEVRFKLARDEAQRK
jgi:hypothetical protein